MHELQCFLSMKTRPLLFLAGIILLMPACKKYEEGPSLSFRSKEARLEGTWKYEKIFVNQKERTLSEEEEKFRLSFYKEGFARKEVFNGSITNSISGNWYWDHRKDNIKLVFDYTYFGTPMHEETLLRIIRLKNKELWLEETASKEPIQYQLIPE